MEATFGISTKGKNTLLYRNFEYVNINGTTSWRCRYHQSLKCNARLLTHGSRVVSDHTHDGNMSESLAWNAVGEMKKAMNDTTLALSAARGRVMTNLEDGVLLALPSRAALSRTLQREKHRIATAAGGRPLPAMGSLSYRSPHNLLPVASLLMWKQNADAFWGVAGDGLLTMALSHRAMAEMHALRDRLESLSPAIPTDLSFDMPTQFADMVLYDSGTGNDIAHLSHS